MHGFVNPRLLAEGSYEFGSSVHPSVVPSARPSSVQKFSWNWSSSHFACPSCNLLESFLGISLLETQRSVMGPSGVVLYLANFFFFLIKFSLGKNYQKWRAGTFLYNWVIRFS